MRNLIIIFSIVCIILVSGCTQIVPSEDVVRIPSTDPQERCIEICRDQIANDVELSNGPCLSEVEELNWNIDDWVCDVAHSPRKLIDNNAQYQCQAFRKEQVNHFIEVTPNCEFIRKA
jgi:hypothetical protein